MCCLSRDRLGNLSSLSNNLSLKYVFSSGRQMPFSVFELILVITNIFLITVHTSTQLFTTIVQEIGIYLETPAAWWFVCLCTVTCCEPTPCCGLCYSYGIGQVPKYDRDLSPLSLKHGKHNTGRMLWIRKHNATLNKSTVNFFLWNYAKLADNYYVMLILHCKRQNKQVPNCCII